MSDVNAFNTENYRRIIEHALERSYKFVTLSEFVALGCPNKGHFILRHDLDKSPATLPVVIDVETQMGVRSTTFVRIAGAEYNPFGYTTMRVLKDAENVGTEVGLHTGFFEFAQINDLDPMHVLQGEIDALRVFFDVRGIAPHRDINYVHNSLPMLEERWDHVKSKMNVGYHAYEDRIMSAVTYVNEGFNPHLCWRTSSPIDVIDACNNGSIYLLTHPHWWYKVHPFEAT